MPLVVGLSTTCKRFTDRSLLNAYSVIGCILTRSKKLLRVCIYNRYLLPFFRHRSHQRGRVRFY